MSKYQLYDAQTVADFVISWCADRNIIITNVKLNKLLYFCQIEFAKAAHRRLISEDFFAYRLGPVIPSLRERYLVYVANPLPQSQGAISVCDSDAETLDMILSHYAPMKTWDLVEKACNTGPFKYNIEIFGVTSIIPYECMLVL